MNIALKELSTEGTQSWEVNFLPLQLPWAPCHSLRPRPGQQAHHSGHGIRQGLHHFLGSLNWTDGVIRNDQWWLARRTWLSSGSRRPHSVIWHIKMLVWGFEREAPHFEDGDVVQIGLTLLGLTRLTNVTIGTLPWRGEPEGWSVTWPVIYMLMDTFLSIKVTWPECRNILRTHLTLFSDYHVFRALS